MKQAGFNGKEEFFFVAHLYWLGMWDFQAVTFLFPIVGGHQQPLKRVTFSPSQKGHQEVFFFLKTWWNLLPKVGAVSAMGFLCRSESPFRGLHPFWHQRISWWRGGEGWMWVKSEKFRYIASNSKLKCLILVWIFKGPRWITLRHTEMDMFEEQTLFSFVFWPPLCCVETHFLWHVFFFLVHHPPES